MVDSLGVRFRILLAAYRVSAARGLDPVGLFLQALALLGMIDDEADVLRAPDRVDLVLHFDLERHARQREFDDLGGDVTVCPSSVGPR